MGLCCCCLSWKVCFKGCIGFIVKKVIVKKAPTFLGGTKLDVTGFQFSVCPLHVKVRGIVLHNPDGYHSEHLLSIDSVNVDVALCQAIKSLGKKIQIPMIAVDGVHLIYEINVGNSNLSTFLDALMASNKEAIDKSESAFGSMGDVRESIVKAAGNIEDAVMMKSTDSDISVDLLDAKKRRRCNFCCGDKEEKKPAGVFIDFIELTDVQTSVTSSYQLLEGHSFRAVNVPDMKIKMADQEASPTAAMCNVINQSANKMMKTEALSEALGSLEDSCVVL